MKKILFILLSMISIQGFPQEYLITGINITLPANPDPKTANWGNGNSMFSISANSKPDPRGGVNKAVLESRILVTIKKGGQRICGTYTPASAPMANFNMLTKVWSGKNGVALLGQDCVLEPGDYEFCVQFFGFPVQGTPPRPLSEEKCRPFSIRNVDQQGFQPPQPITPANGTVIAQADAGKPVTFRWTPMIPKPGDPVTYRLSVWQLMQGQNGMQAMQSNQPVATKDVENLNQAIISNLLTGPCRPPYLCDFVWNVQAIDKQGKGFGRNEGKSELFAFSFADKSVTQSNPSQPGKMMGGANAEFRIDSVICLKKENGLFRYHIWAHYENLSSSVDNILLNDNLSFAGYPANPNPGTGLNLRNNIRLKSGSYNGALTMNDILEASSGTISNITPTPASVFTPAMLTPGTQHSFQFDFAIATNSPVQFTYYGLVDDALRDKANRNARNEIDSLKYPQCPCDACEEVTIKPTLSSEIKNNGNGNLTFAVNLSAAPKKVKRIKTDLVYFEMKPDDPNCLICNQNSNTFGNFSSVSAGNPAFTGGITAGHTASFDALSDTDISNGVALNFSVSIPPLVDCCNATLNFCIRHIITFDDCTVCNVLACYPYKITGCPK